MKTQELDYFLPPELIAQKPAEKREFSRLLILNRKNGSLKETVFAEIGNLLDPNDCLVINNTKVLPAKFFAARKSGAKIEGLFLSAQNNLWAVMLKNSAKIKNGETLNLIAQNKTVFCQAIAEKNNDGNWNLTVQSQLNPHTILENIGSTPLPPYIKRNCPLENLDKDRYQTVYAEKYGAVAAPTAGLHFTEQLLKKLKSKGIKTASITLHISQGTFLPVKTETLEEHKIHKEWFALDEKNSQIINNTIASNGRIIAVGTTAVRSLESIAKGRNVSAQNGWTDIFITPGFKFNIVDGLITNFHLPKSTLLALVGAFAGMDKVMAAYRYAVEKKFRFYSYGDCMLIL